MYYGLTRDCSLYLLLEVHSTIPTESSTLLLSPNKKPIVTSLSHEEQQQKRYKDEYYNSINNINEQRRQALIQRRQFMSFSLADFQLLRTLGTGSFGRVRLCRSIHNNHYYAIKIMLKTELYRLKQMNHTNSERKMLMQVVHPFIVNLWGTFQDTYYLYMVMDFIPGGELFSILKAKKVIYFIIVIIMVMSSMMP